jgi:tetratricopeptide (TPR) repeat protein
MLKLLPRVVAWPFVTLFAGASTALDIVLLAWAIADAKTNPEKKHLLDQDHIKLILDPPKTVDPQRAADLQRQADKAKTRGDLEKAIRLYGRAIDCTPHNAALFLLRGSALIEVDRPRDAAKDFVAGLQLDPGNQTLTFLMHTANAKAAERAASATTALQRQADTAKSRGELEKAIGLYGRAIHQTPHNAALFLLRGSVLIEVDRPKDAAKDFVAGLELDPGNQTLTFLMHTANAKAAEQAASAMAYPPARALGKA